MTMQIEQTTFENVVILHSTAHEDERGSFERIWSHNVLSDRGLSTSIVQVSLATNRLAGTIRGLHFSVLPHTEAKYLRCLRGEIYDVVVNLLPQSPNYGNHLYFRLYQGDGQTLCIPPGYAHGYQTLTHDTEIVYFIDQAYHPQAARVIRYDDSDLNIAWPLPVSLLSTRDAEGIAFRHL